MLTKFATGLTIVVFHLSADTLLAGTRTEQIVQAPDEMSVQKVENFFTSNLDADEITWLPLEQGTTRLGLNIPRRGFEQAVEFQDGNSLFYLSTVTDLGFHLQKSKKFSVGFNLGLNGYLLEINRDINNGLIGSLVLEYMDELNIIGFLDKSLVYNNSILSSRIGYSSDATGYIGGHAVQLSLDGGLDLFGWTNFSTENNDSILGFGKTWFDVEYGLDNTLMTNWDSKGWTAGLLLSKIQGKANFAAGLVDIDQNFRPTFYVEFSTPLENLEKFSSTSLLNYMLLLLY